MIVALVAFAVVSVTLVAVVYLLGFRLGGGGWLSEVNRVRAEAAHAERQLHELTRQAFVSMAEHVEEQNKR